MERADILFIDGKGVLLRQPHNGRTLSLAAFVDRVFPFVSFPLGVLFRQLLTWTEASWRTSVEQLQMCRPHTVSDG